MLEEERDLVARDLVELRAELLWRGAVKDEAKCFALQLREDGRSLLGRQRLEEGQAVLERQIVQKFRDVGRVQVFDRRRDFGRVLADQLLDVRTDHLCKRHARYCCIGRFDSKRDSWGIG